MLCSVKRRLSAAHSFCARWHMVVDEAREYAKANNHVSAMLQLNESIDCCTDCSKLKYRGVHQLNGALIAVKLGSSIIVACQGQYQGRNIDSHGERVAEACLVAPCLSVRRTGLPGVAKS